MEITSKLNNFRTAPRKVRKAADLVRGKGVLDARNLLSFTVNKSALPLLKLLNSAAASALHEFQLQESNLYISKLFVDEGPKLKRWRAMSRGRGYPILKRTSHITLVLSEKSPTAKKEPAVKEKIARIKPAGANPEETLKKNQLRKLKR